MTLLLKVLVVALGLLFIEWLIPGIEIDGFYTALVAAIVLGLFNITIKPILIILTLPINILTLGLFTFVINAALFLFASSILEGFFVDGFVSALIGSLLLSLISTAANRLLA